MDKKQRKNAESVADCLQQLQELTGSEGNYAYRGQKNADWEKVESGAFRRLKKKTDSRVEENEPSKEDFISYHEKELLEPARMDGHGVGEDRPLYDLELLAKLQHHGAATCLIDFTRNFLVAMWFACESHKEEVKEKGEAKEEEKNGKIFILETSNWKNFLSLEEKDLEKKIRPILTFQTRGEASLSKETRILSIPKPSWWYWSPHGFIERILKQDSLFIFGQTKIEDALLKKVEISGEAKDKIREELERLGITERTLFKDLPGFAESHGRDKSLSRKYGKAEYYLRKGNEALQRGDSRGAIADYNEAIKLNSEYAEAYYNRGNVNRILRCHNDAIVDYDRVIKLDSSYVLEAHFNRGNVKFSLGDHSGAIVDYNEAIKLKPCFAGAYNNRGNVKSDLVDHSGAMADYDRAIELKPDFAEAYNNRGSFKFMLGDNPGAIADYNEAIKFKPEYVEAYNNRGIARSASGDHSGAMADYNRAIELEPDFAESYNNRGIAKFASGDRSGAMADYNRAIELKPDFAEAYDNRGNAKSSLGTHSGAMVAMGDHDRAIELKPDYAEAYNNRGNANRILGHNSEAIADYDRTIKLKPDYAKAYYNRGLAYASLKEIDKARRDILKAKELAERSGDAQLLGLIDKLLSELDNGNNSRS